MYVWAGAGAAAVRTHGAKLLASHLGEVVGELGWHTAPFQFSLMYRQVQGYESSHSHLVAITPMGKMRAPGGY